MPKYSTRQQSTAPPLKPPARRPAARRPMGIRPGIRPGILPPGAIPTQGAPSIGPVYGRPGGGAGTTPTTTGMPGLAPEIERSRAQLERFSTGGGYGGGYGGGGYGGGGGGYGGGGGGLNIINAPARGPSGIGPWGGPMGPHGGKYGPNPYAEGGALFGREAPIGGKVIGSPGAPIYTPQAGGGGAAGGGGGVMGAYDQATGEARRTNLERYQNLLGLGEQRYGTGMEMVSQMGGSQAAEIDRIYGARLGTVQQDLISRGLANASTRTTGALGVERERTRAHGELQDRLLSQRLGVHTGLSGDVMGVMERREDVPPNLSQLLALAGQYGQGMGGQGGYGGGMPQMGGGYQIPGQAWGGPIMPQMYGGGQPGGPIASRGKKQWQPYKSTRKLPRARQEQITPLPFPMPQVGGEGPWR